MTDAVSFIEHFTYIGIFCFLILGGPGFPFPEDGVLVIAGLLIAQDVIKFMPSIAIIYPSILVADFILYNIGRRYGKNIIYHRRFAVLISAVTINRLEKRFNRWGVLMVAAGRHMPGLRMPVFLIAGIVGISRLKFLIADAISAVFSVTLMLGLGYFAGNSLSALRRSIIRIDHIAILAVSVVILAAFVASFFRRRRKERSLSRTNKSQV